MHPTRVIVPSLAVLSLIIPAFAAPPGDRLLDQVTQAHRDTQQYQAVIHLEMNQNQGRWRSTQATEIPLALDRESSRLVVDKPDMLLVVDDKLRLKSDQLPGRHLEVDRPEPLTYEVVTQEVPFIAQPAMPVLAFLLSPDPVSAISEGASNTATTLDPEPQDQAQRPRLQFKSNDATYTLSINPETHLIERAVIDVDPAAMGGQPGQSLQVTYDYELQGHNDPIDDEAFAFDTTGSTAAGSLQELMTSGGGAGGAGGGGGHALQDQEAPAIDLPLADGGEFKLEDVEEQVVVLDFWATWCPPCREGLPKIQEVSDWASEQDKSVAVLTVNVGETAEQATEFWQEHGFTMPIVMDTNNVAAQAYGVTGIPQTVVIADGHVKHVHVGFSPDMADTLKSQIDALLQP